MPTNKVDTEIVLEVVEATLADANIIAEIQKITCLATYPNATYLITKQDLLHRLSTVVSADKWQEVLVKKDSKTFVAKVDNEIVGFCFCKKEVERGHIGSIYILPTQQGKGIGQIVLAEAIVYLGRQKPIALEVVVYNTNAILFYKKLGFIESGKAIKPEQTVVFKSGTVLPEIEMVLPQE